MYLKLVIITLVASIVPTNAFNPGGTMSIDLNTLREAKNVYFNYIINLLNTKVHIPNISFDHGHIENNSFHVSDSSSGVTLNADSGNIVQLNVNNLAASFHSSSLEYKVWFYTAHGSLDVSMSDVSLELKLKLETQRLSNGKIVPAF